MNDRSIRQRREYVNRRISELKKEREDLTATRSSGGGAATASPADRRYAVARTKEIGTELKTLAAEKGGIKDSLNPSDDQSA